MPFLGEVLGHLLTRLRQPGRHGQHPVMLGLVALDLPIRVVQVLPAPGVVGADSLEMAVRPRADPHLLPRRRDHQGPAALDVGAVQALAVQAQVYEPLALTTARPAGLAG
jgi:hypothetical protein